MQISRSEFFKARFALLCLGLCDPRRRQWILSQDHIELVPRQHLSARAAVQPCPPNTADLPIEPVNTPIVRSASVVLVVAAELGIQGLLLLAHRVVAVLFAPSGDLF